MTLYQYFKGRCYVLVVAPARFPIDLSQLEVIVCVVVHPCTCSVSLRERHPESLAQPPTLYDVVAQ